MLIVIIFGIFGYDDLYKEYEKVYLNVKIEVINIDMGGNVCIDVFIKIVVGFGFSDIVVIEEGWFGVIMDVFDIFVDLCDYGIEDCKDDWVDWKYGQVIDVEGWVIGYGIDIGLSGICYNGVVFEVVGFLSDCEFVVELFNGDWENYFKVGVDYMVKIGKVWYDYFGFVWNVMVNQFDEGYYIVDGELNVEGNDEFQECFELLGVVIEGGQFVVQIVWDWNGGKLFVDGMFVIFVCFGWMFGVVQGQVEVGGGDVLIGWDFVDVFFGGVVNWGGVFLLILEILVYKEVVVEFVDWLMQFEQQVKQFVVVGNFLLIIKVQEFFVEEVMFNEFFNDVLIGVIFVEWVKGVVVQFKGVDDLVIQENVFGLVFSSFDCGEINMQGVWDQVIGLLNDFVG